MGTIMNKKLLVAHAEGLGNCLEIIPCLRTIKEVLAFEITYWHSFGNFHIPNTLIPYVDKFLSGAEIRTINPKDYAGIVSTYWTRNHIKPLGMKLLSNIYPLRMDISEVDTYLSIARDLEVEEKDLLWHGKCNYKVNDEKYDIVLANGYNRYGSADWSIKSYPYYEKLASLLNEGGYSVCSVGAPNEYVQGTIDKTGLDLLSSGGLLKNSRLLISNDSAMYHYANTLSVKNIVIFTATSVEKNFDKRFHKYSTIIGRSDLKCRPCQAGRGWKKCKTWECREIQPELIVDKVKEIIE